MNLKKILFIPAVIFTIAVLFITANNNQWKFHSETDVRTFYNRFTQFSEQSSFKNFDQNEFLPGSLFFFITPGLLNKNTGYDSYLINFIFINLFLIALHFIIYKKIAGLNSAYMAVPLFLTLGPILLFRFELVTSLIFIIAIYLFIKKKYLFSGVALGAAFMTKIYPVFVLPYFLILLFKNDKLSAILKYLSGFILGAFIFIATYVFLGGNAGDTITNLIYHADKPIGIESMVASIESFKSLTTSSHLPQIAMLNGIWGIPESIKPSLVEYIPYAVLSLFYLGLLFVIKKGSDFTVRIPILILFIFLFFSKYLNPQYLFWIFGLIPLINFKKEWKDISLILNTLVLLILTQLTFPLYFTNLLDAFNSGMPNTVFYILQIRNFLMIVELILLFLSLKSSEKSTKDIF